MSTAQRLGVLGDGQLAQMLIHAAKGLGFNPKLFGKKNSPAGLVASDVYSDEWDYVGFFRSVEICVVESEFVDASLIEASGGDKKIRPPLHAIRLLQNKLQQKRLLKRLGVASSPFLEPAALSQSVDIAKWLESCQQQLGSRFVLKFATLGYDGKGVCIHTSDSLKQSLSFIGDAHKRRIEVYAEAYVDFVRELAIAGSINPRGEMVFYPLVVSEQKQGICDIVYGPARLFGTTEKQEEIAKMIMKSIAEATGLIGTFAIEFFESKDGEILVNEIAPRVHNSAHYTIDSSETSQFENHWRAVLGMPLGSTVTSPFFVMANILGQVERSLDDIQLGGIEEPMKLHWYGKMQSRPGRKLGHLNLTLQETKNMKGVIENVRRKRDQWQEKNV